MEHASLKIAGTDFEVVDLDGREAVDELFELKLLCRAQVGAQRPGELIGAEASVTLFDGYGASRVISGLVTEAVSTCYDDGSVTLACTVRSAAYLLLLGRNCRTFHELDVVGVVDAVIGGVPHRWELGGSYATRPYCAQYREDDWTFVCRLLEQEGIHFWLDHAQGSMLVFSDDSTAAPELDGGALIELAVESGQHSDREVIEELGGAAAVTPTKFSINSFDPERPDLAVTGSTGSGMLEIYDAPGGGPTTPDGCARQAQLLGQAAAAAAAGVNGQSSSVRIVPGRIFEVSGHPLASLDRRYLATTLRYRVRQRRKDDGDVERAYVCWFSGISESTPHVPERNTGPAQQAGIQSAIVGGPPGEEIHPDPLGRVRVQLHWDREGTADDRSGTWMRVAQRGTADSMQLPRMGWNVLTCNEEGAVDAPYVLSRIHDAEHPPAYPLPANKTRVVYKTATTPEDGSFNEIYFEDSKGNEEVFMNASRDMNVLVQMVKTEGVGNDNTRTVGNNHTLTVAKDVTELVINDQAVSVGANDTAEIGSSRDEAVGGDRNISIGGKRSLKTGANHLIAVEGTRDVSVSAALIDTSLGNISSGADIVTLLAGGAQLKLAAQSITEDCGGASVQTIGGAKLEFGNGNRTLDVSKNFFETVGGLMMLQADGTYLDGARQIASWTAGISVSSTSPSLLVEAIDKIELHCGGSVIVIEPSQVEIRATELDLSEASSVEIETPKIEHN
jgi:type VI secretion system secreted protein VgrG